MINREVVRLEQSHMEKGEDGLNQTLTSVVHL